jgi:phosphotransferase system enzyme I (PtsI)
MELTGKSVFGGVAIGKICVYQKKDNVVKRIKVDDPDVELERFETARVKAQEQLAGLYEKAKKEVGEAEAAVFEVHQMFLDDLDYIESIQNIIKNETVNAEFAVAKTGDNFSEMFANMDDEYMQGRAADVLDVSNRVVSVLQDNGDAGFSATEPSILLADDLAPSETVQLDKSLVLSFVTRKGSTSSHTAILARTMGIPALIQVDFPDDVNGKMGIVDGTEGKIIIDPDDTTVEIYKKKLEKELEKKKLLEELKDKPTETVDGKSIHLYSNIGGVGDVASVLENGSEGVGLFRSEFLYLESNDFPSEETQFKAYRTVLENMAGKKVIIRTLDIGADKQVDYLNLGDEENPALGYRAIRICLTQTDIFKTQLRALLRASYYGNLGIMFPMIISMDEIRQIKSILDDVKKELKEAGVPFKDPEIGIMIETPAAVLLSEEFAKEVDFFSIGTNDLTQYTLAIDRQNAKLENINDPHHPAVLAAIKMTIENGHKGGAWVGICGELGADTTLTETFLRYGVDELSVSPGRTLSVRDAVRKVDLSK